MSKMHKEFLKCPDCGREIEYDYWDSVNVSLDPKLKEYVLDGSIFNCSCICGYDKNLVHPFLYHDMNKKLLIQLTSIDEVEEVIESYEEVINLAFSEENIRIVTDYNELIEKIHIFDADFDDKVIELTKSIFRKAYKENNPSIKDFKILFSPPDLKSELESEHDYHLKLFNFEEGFYQIIPLDKSKLEKYAEYIESVEKRLKKHTFIISEAWSDSILNGEARTDDGFYSIIDEDKSFQNKKYHEEYEKTKAQLSDINEIDSEGYTLLKYAVLAEDYNEIKSLLEKGANPNIRMDENRVVLHYALQYGVSEKIIDLLMEYGADINVVAAHKLKPLDLIDRRKSVEYLNHMFEIGATCNGDALLRMYATRAEDVECIKYLMAKGYSLEARDKNDFNASCEAICNNYSNHFLEEFLKIGGNPNAKYRGYPCFFSVFEEYHADAREEGFYLNRLKLLFKYGADINITDSSKCSAIMAACKKCCRKEIIQLLLSYKPDLTLKDSEGKDVYDYLQKNENISQRQKTEITDLLNMALRIS